MAEDRKQNTERDIQGAEHLTADQQHLLTSGLNVPRTVYAADGSPTKERTLEGGWKVDSVHLDPESGKPYVALVDGANIDSKTLWLEEVLAHNPALQEGADEDTIPREQLSEALRGAEITTDQAGELGREAVGQVVEHPKTIERPVLNPEDLENTFDMLARRIEGVGRSFDEQAEVPSGEMYRRIADNAETIVYRLRNAADAQQGAEIITTLTREIAELEDGVAQLETVLFEDVSELYQIASSVRNVNEQHQLDQEVVNKLDSTADRVTRMIGVYQDLRNTNVNIRTVVEMLSQAKAQLLGGGQLDRTVVDPILDNMSRILDYPNHEKSIGGTTKVDTGLIADFSAAKAELRNIAGALQHE